MQMQSIIIMIMILQFNFLLLFMHWCSFFYSLWIKDEQRGIELKN